MLAPVFRFYASLRHKNSSLQGNAAAGAMNVTSATIDGLPIGLNLIEMESPQARYECGLEMKSRTSETIDTEPRVFKKSF